MLTRVWLVCPQHELTKPKLTFCPQNFLLGLRTPHEQSFPFPTVGGPDGGQSRRWAVVQRWAVVARGQSSGVGTGRGGTGRVGTGRRTEIPSYCSIKCYKYNMSYP